MKQRQNLDRRSGVDLWRALGCLAVIFLHQTHADYGTAGNVSDVLDQVMRWAVPFFFIMAGYFLREGTGWLSATWGYVKRLMPVFIVWGAIYLTASGQWGEHFGSPFAIAKLIVTGGPGYHLWFLASLMLCISLLLLLLQLFSKVTVGVICGLFFVVGLVGGGYESVLDPGLENNPIRIPNTRDGPFFGLIFLYLGVLLRDGVLRPSLAKGIVLIAVGGLLSAIEITALWAFFERPIIRNEFVIGTLFLGLGTAYVALSVEVANTRLRRAITTIGGVTLGLYAVHVLVLQAANTLLEPNSLLAGVAVALLTMTVSTVIAVLGSRIPVVRRIFV